MKFQLFLMILVALLNVTSAHRAFLHFKRIQRGLVRSQTLDQSVITAIQIRRKLALMQAKQRLLRFESARF